MTFLLTKGQASGLRFVARGGKTTVDICEKKNNWAMYFKHHKDLGVIT